MEIILEEWADFTTTDNDVESIIECDNLFQLKELLKEKTEKSNSCFLIYNVDDDKIHIICDPNH